MSEAQPIEGQFPPEQLQQDLRFVRQAVARRESAAGGRWRSTGSGPSTCWSATA